MVAIFQAQNGNLYRVKNVLECRTLFKYQKYLNPKILKSFMSEFKINAIIFTIVKQIGQIQNKAFAAQADTIGNSFDF